MIKKKKFLFWLVQEFEKDLRKTVNIFLINSVTAVSKFIKPKNKFHRFFNRFFSVRGGKKKRWGQRIIFNDIMWTSLISIRYHCVSFLAENIAVQLRKRKKHWRYIHMMKRILTDTLPRFYFKYGMGEIYTIKVSINGKINGRNRTINHIFLKKIKDKQYPRTHQLYLYANYGFREVLSRYGLFAVKIWFFRV